MIITIIILLLLFANYSNSEVKKHKELMDYAIERYSFFLREYRYLTDMDTLEHLLVMHNLQYGICHLLHKGTEVPALSLVFYYWIKRNTRKDSHWCDTSMNCDDNNISSNWVELCQYRLDLLKKERKAIGRFGYMARFINIK